MDARISSRSSDARTQGTGTGSRTAAAGGMALMLLAVALTTSAQSYNLDWFTLDGGGGTSTGGVYSLTGTIGQPDAGAMSGDNYSLVGGFWGVVAAVQTPGAPLLSVTRTNGVVTVYWPLPATDFVLEQSLSVPFTPPNWSQVPTLYQTNATHISVTVPAPVDNKFYRLRRP